MKLESVKRPEMRPAIRQRTELATKPATELEDIKRFSIGPSTWLAGAKKLSPS